MYLLIVHESLLPRSARDVKDVELRRFRNRRVRGDAEPHHVAHRTGRLCVDPMTRRPPHRRKHTRCPYSKNSKHELFAQGLSNRAAFAQAGYKPSDSTASHLANSDKVRAQVDEPVSASATKAGVTIDRIAKIAFRDIRRALDRGMTPPDEDGKARNGA
jgi:hypothetical protein